MNVSSCMKQNVVSIKPDTTIREAGAIIVKKHIGLLPVVDKDNKPIGMVGLRDLLKLELPDFVNFVEDVDFVHDFGAVEVSHPLATTLNRKVKSLMSPAIMVDEDCGLLRAYALMLQQNLHDMPVVSKDGKLVGITSRVDIGVAVLSTWGKI
ncbi:MAG TPA: CBS domain-containing protein [Anaerolineales bacterium]|nr:CBS domain-containing protein [Anaerolineales bacterium]